VLRFVMASVKRKPRGTHSRAAQDTGRESGRGRSPDSRLGDFHARLDRGEVPLVPQHRGSLRAEPREARQPERVLVERSHRTWSMMSHRVALFKIVVTRMPTMANFQGQVTDCPRR
jgi:hypothetical protein